MKALLLFVCGFSMLCEAATKPVAYVYIAKLVNLTSSQEEIIGYSISPAGEITKIPGSPFAVGYAGGNPLYLAGNGSWVFASDVTGHYITTYEIESDGALKLVQVLNAVALAEDPSSTLLYGPLVLDRTGETLYATANTGETAHNLVFRIDNGNGSLEFIGEGKGQVGNDNGQPMVFSGNNKFAYVSIASGYAVATNNELIPLPLPSVMYRAGDVTADNLNNLAVEEIVDKDRQLGTYQIDAQGNLSTKGTEEDRPLSHIQGLNTISMSPSGELLAAGGAYGLELYHFNGANPITLYHILLSTAEDSNNAVIYGINWDNDNHLYAFGGPGYTREMRVYTATPTDVQEAKGSPFLLEGALNLSGVLVHSLTK
jgi:hypothetical protein